MKILKYRTTWAWGYGDWNLSIISKKWNDLEYENIKELVEKEIIPPIHREHNFSNKYRGVEYDIFNIKDLNDDDKNKMIKTYKRRLVYSKKQVEDILDILKELME